MKTILKPFVQFLLIFNLFFFINAFAQSNVEPTDSLKQLLNSAIHDTVRVDVLNSIAETYMDQEQTDSALKYCTESIKLAEKVEFNSGLALGLANLGTIRNDEQNYPEAMRHFQRALKIYTNQND